MIYSDNVSGQLYFCTQSSQYRCMTFSLWLPWWRTSWRKGWPAWWRGPEPGSSGRWSQASAQQDKWHHLPPSRSSSGCSKGEPEGEKNSVHAGFREIQSNIKQKTSLKPKSYQGEEHKYQCQNVDIQEEESSLTLEYLTIPVRQI